MPHSSNSLVTSCLVTDACNTSVVQYVADTTSENETESPAEASDTSAQIIAGDFQHDASVTSAYIIAEEV